MGFYSLYNFKQANTIESFHPLVTKQINKHNRVIKNVKKHTKNQINNIIRKLKKIYGF